MLNAWLVVGSSVGGIVNEISDTKLPLGDLASMAIEQDITLPPSGLLYLKLQFTEHNMTTPVFRGAKLKYNVV